MPRLYMSIAKGNAGDLRNILLRTPRIPDTCQWCTFLRNHDELTLEMVSEDERQWMWKRYAPEARMRLNLGIRRRLAPLLGNDARKIKLLHSLLFTLPGSPIIYYGDEIGMGDNISLAGPPRPPHADAVDLRVQRRLLEGTRRIALRACHCGQ